MRMICLTVCMYFVSAAISDAAWHDSITGESPYSPQETIFATFNNNGLATRWAAFGYFEDTDEDTNYGGPGDDFFWEMEKQVTTVYYAPGFYYATAHYDPTAPTPDTPWRDSPDHDRDHAVVVMADGSSTGYQDRETQTPCVEID